VFEKFTDRARRVLVLAQEEARLLNHSFIGTEHLLLGLIDEGEGIAAKALEQLDISLEAVRERVEEVIGLSGTWPTGSPPFTPRAKKVMELSLREAMQLGHQYISTEHMLLDIVREGEGVAAQVLVSLGADLARVRQKVIELLSGYVPEGAGGIVSDPIRQETASDAGRSRLVACSFCRRQPPESGRLVSGTDAYICEHCIRQWSSVIDEPAFARVQRHVVTHISQGPMPSGPPPDDPGAAEAEIAASFASFATVTEDGQSLPMVEKGEGLGPTQTEAAERRRDMIPENAEVTASIDRIVFTSASHAAVWFTLSADGRPLLSHNRGDAVVVDRAWKMARSTFCNLMGLAGVQCPPETD